MGAVVALISSMLLVSAPFAAAAVNLNSEFQLDGNAVVDASPAVGTDWEALYNGTGPAGMDFTSIVSDVPATDGNYFTGGGSKDPLDIPNWRYNSNGAPAKDEITDAYGAAKLNADGKKVLYFGADRFDNSGDSQLGFWFFQNAISLSGGKFTGTHVAKNGSQHGDVLVLSDFTNGGAVGTINVYEWVGSGGSNGALNHIYPNSTTVVDCVLTGGVTSDVCGTVNKTDGVTAPWPYTNKSGQSTFAHGEFYEGAVNLGDLFPDSNPCFASFMAETRSSQSPSAVLKDLVLHSFEPCSPTTSLAASPTVASSTTVLKGSNQTFTFTETNDGNTALTSPSVTTTTAGCLTPANVSGDDGNGKLDPGEAWVFTCTLNNLQSSVTITATGHGTDPLGRDVTYCAAPQTTDATHLCDADERATAAVTVISPSTTMLQTAATTSASPIHAGESVTLSFYDTNDGDTVISSPSVGTDYLGCSPTRVTGVAGGDADNDGVFDPGETWKWTCSATFTTNATANGTVVTATADGLDPLGNHVTYPGDPQEQTSVTVLTVNPSTTLTATASAVVTYTFTEHNGGDSALTAPSVTLGANTECDSAPAYVSGDTGNDGILGIGETWTFRCTKTINGLSTDTGTISGSATGTGHGTDATGTDVTHCATVPTSGKYCSTTERDGVTVAITNNARD